MTRAFHRGYRSARTCRLHIICEDGRFAGRSGECGVHAWDGRDSVTVVLDPMPLVPPAGLSWCPPCVGRLAERRGLLASWAAEMAGAR